MKVLQSGPIMAWRQHHTTGEVTQEELRYEIQDKSEDRDHTWVVFQLFGGPTGYESFVIQDEDDRLWDPAGMHKSGFWSACGGTKGSWHAMRVTKEEMRRVLKDYLPENQKLQPLRGQEAWAIGIEHKPGEFGMTHGPMKHIAFMLRITGQRNSCIIHFFGDGTEEVTHRWKDNEWVAVQGD